MYEKENRELSSKGLFGYKIRRKINIVAKIAMMNRSLLKKRTLSEAELKLKK